MREEVPERSLRRTLIWFAAFAAAYLTTMLIAGSILGGLDRATFFGSLTGILIVTAIVVWWRHFRSK